MPYVGRWNAVLLEEFFLEGKDTEKTVERRAHGLHPALLPGPGLRGHQVDDRHALTLQLARQRQMEAGRVGKDGDVGRLSGAGVDQLVHLTQDAGDVRDHLDDADHGQRTLVYYSSHSG